MRRRIVLVLAAIVISSVFLASAPAGAVTGISASLCVNGETSQFEYEVTAAEIESPLVEFNLINQVGSIQWIVAVINVDQTDGSLTPSAYGLEVIGAPPLPWALPFSSNSVSSVAGATKGWDVTWTGSVANGPNPYSPGDTLYLAFAGDLLINDAKLFTVPITDCNEGSTTTTEEVTTTTEEVTTTTAGATTSSTVPPTVAPTSIVSTTVVETTTIPEVETDIANGDGTTPAVPVLIGVGFLTLAAVAVRARRMER